MGSTESRGPLRIFFLPLMSPGHMIPMVDIAKLVAARGPDVSATIITTPANEHLIRPSIASLPIDLLIVPFPSSVAHLLPGGNENLNSISFSDFKTFFEAFYALQEPLDELLFARRPHCIISDYMFTWTADTAAALGIPRIVFYGHGIFPSCVHESLHVYGQHEKVADSSEVFVVEGLPHRIELTSEEVSLGVKYTTKEMRESVEKSHGVIVNSFCELEPAYAELYRKGRRAYYVGPVSLASAGGEEANRGRMMDPKLEGAMTWLDSMEEGSVMYVCFGSLNEFSAEQLREIAVGLEESGRPFVWAVRMVETKDFLPEGYEERVKGKGVVVRGWAPQAAILSSQAVGGFVTHCGWNSVLEAVTEGVPMVAWPVEYEQFVNERLIVQVLKVGVGVGRGEKGSTDGKRVVKAKAIAEAVEEVMGEGEEAEARRRRAREYAGMAKAAMEEGGSSYLDLSRLIDEIRDHAKESS